MLIFGTRGKRIEVPLANGQVLVLLYRYFHLFWAVRLAYGKKYLLGTQTEAGWASRPVDAEEAQRLLQGQPLPQPSLWDRFSLIGLVLIFVLYVGAAQLMGPGSA